MTSVPQTKPPDGFRRWWVPGQRDVGPYGYAAVEVWQYGATETWVASPGWMKKYVNVYGLYWRPVRKGDETVQ